ncbi:unnamed protein product [Toxocara canis]|uniref:RNA-binding protein n=1 Tax=Toxocara canis TaxID=6265 RepID=A0A183UG95_TOXCA|nr:unnamed protein product [Toxocara canis]
MWSPLARRAGFLNGAVWPRCQLDSRIVRGLFGLAQSNTQKKGVTRGRTHQITSTPTSYVEVIKTRKGEGRYGARALWHARVCQHARASKQSPQRRPGSPNQPLYIHAEGCTPTLIFALARTENLRRTHTYIHAPRTVVSIQKPVTRSSPPSTYLDPSPTFDS